MNHKTLDELVRKQILAEDPEPTMREDYVPAQIDNLSNSELLERISYAHEEQLRELLDHIKNYL